MLFLGQAKTGADYDFLAKYGDEIVIGEAKVYPKAGEDKIEGVEEAQSGYLRTSAPSDALHYKIREHMERLLAAAGNDVQRLGWIAEQLINHVAAPSHWGLHEQIIREGLEKEARRKAEARETEHQSSRKHGENVA